MPKSHKPITRKTERLAIQPESELYIDTQFIAPYGIPIRQSLVDEFTTDTDGDMGPVDHVGINKNEAHTRMMTQDYTFPHERRALGENWDVNEALAYQAEIDRLAAEREYARIWAENQKELGWLDTYFGANRIIPEDSELSLKQLTQKYEWLDDYFTPDFEEIEFTDDVLPSTGNSMSPISVSTGRVIAQNNSDKSAPVNMVRSEEHEKFVEGLGKLIKSRQEDFVSVNITIPAYVSREYWLEYSLKLINPPGVDITRDIPKVSMCLLKA